VTVSEMQTLGFSTLYIMTTSAVYKTLYMVLLRLDSKRV